MAFNATFINISVISRRLVLLVAVSDQNDRQMLSHNTVSSAPRHEQDLNTQLLW